MAIRLWCPVLGCGRLVPTADAGPSLGRNRNELDHSKLAEMLTAPFHRIAIETGLLDLAEGRTGAVVHKRPRGLTRDVDVDASFLGIEDYQRLHGAVDFAGEHLFDDEGCEQVEFSTESRRNKTCCGHFGSFSVGGGNSGAVAGSGASKPTEENSLAHRGSW